ncbi:MAG: hypothetical protein AAFQ79_10840 [Pseudomonadota bacterium]
MSYGTFSCTLEGFDDPFSTMKSIAEYFRDLAADDRYFGAEPPTPDAEMLHRIAEQEVQRRVEARVQDDGIVLRQVEPVAETPEPAPQPAPVAAPAPVVKAVDTVPEPAQATVEGDEGSIAAKLSRIRAVVARNRPVEEADDEFDAPLPSDPYSGSIESAFDDVSFEDETPPIADVTPALEPVPQPAKDAPDVTLGEAFADAEDEDAGADAVDEGIEEVSHAAEELGVEDHAPAAPAASDIASRIIQLKRSDAQHAEPIAAVKPVPTDTLDEAEVDRPAVLGHDADDTALFEEATFDLDDADLDDAPLDAADGDLELDDLHAIEDEEDLQDLAALDGVDEGPSKGLEPVSTESPAEEAGAEDDVDEVVEAVEDAAPVEDDYSDADDADTLASVTAALSDGEEAVASEEPVSPEVEPVSQSVEEIVAEAAQDEDPAEEDDTTAFEPEPDGEAAFDRILEETNSKLDEDESSRRRSAIAHLKAAVAATKADLALGRGTAKEEEDADEQSRYRADLAKVVRPRKPDETKASSERPAPIAETPSPLMLVSSQRVDSGVKTEGPKSVLPRRVNTQTIKQMEDPMAEGSGGFAEFAKQMGATELPDLLEAAAAYSAFVEGRREFSRPQLMRRVASFERETFTREAGLRSFGQLLRQGKIQKLKRGQFTVTDETRFNPEARVAGE